MFTTRWILIKVGNRSLITLVDTIFSIVYGPTYQSTNFLAGLSLNTKSLVLNITLSPFFQFSVYFLSLFACLFIFSCTFFNTAPASLYAFFILSTNSVVHSTFPFFLISLPHSQFFSIVCYERQNFSCYMNLVVYCKLC